MQCKNCGCEITNNTKFCRNCGTEIDWGEVSAQSPDMQGAVPEPKSVFCKSCGAPMRLGAKFCGACGAVQQGKTAPNPVAREQEPNKVQIKRQKGLIIFLSVLLALLLTAGAVFAYVLLKEDDEEGKEDDRNMAKTTSSVATETPMTTASPRPTEKPKKSMYYVIKSDVTWEEARAAAEREGGHLVTIDSAEEFEKVWKLAQDEGLICIWAGAKRDVRESWADTKWLDGAKMKYTPWYTDAANRIIEPSNHSEEGEPEQYLTIFKKTKDMWYFNDTVNDISKHYSGKMGYVIEIEV